MVASESVHIFVSYIFRDVLYGFLLGFKDGCFGLITVSFSLIRGYSNRKDLQHNSRDLSTTRSQKNLKSRSSTKRHYSEYDLSVEVMRCSFFNAVCFLSSAAVYQVLYIGFAFLNSDDSTWISFICAAILRIFWTIPVFLIVKFSNIIWFQEIGDRAYELYHGKSTLSLPNLGIQISDILCSTVIELMFLAQSALMMFVPYPRISFALGIIHYSLGSSLYSFEFLWCKKGWSLYRRISYLEANWPYFLGFGMPLAGVSIYFDIFYSGLIYSILFPFFIIAAIRAPRLVVQNRGPSLKLFCGVIWISSLVSNILFRNISRNRRSR